MPFREDGAAARGGDTARPLPMRRAAMGYREPAMAPLELPSSPVPLATFHPRVTGAVRWQPTRALPQFPALSPSAGHASTPAPAECGVGLSLGNRHADPWAAVRVTILAVKPSSPAGFCGRLAIDDEILAVDEQSTEGMDAAQVSRLVRGPEGSLVRLALRKCNDRTYCEVYLMRAHLIPNDSARISPADGGLHGTNPGAGIGVTIVNGQLAGTWQARSINLGGGAWLGSPDWSREGQDVSETCLRDGDVIWSVNRKPVRKIQKPQCALRGAPFTRVSLKIQRETQCWCVDVVRTQLLEVGPELDACIQYRQKLGDKLMHLVARFPEYRWHLSQQHGVELTPQPNCPQRLRANSDGNVSHAQTLSPTGCTLIPSMGLRGLGIEGGWQVQPAESALFPSFHQGGLDGPASPCGSVDSLDAIIQRLDQASSQGETILRQGPDKAEGHGQQHMALSHLENASKGTDIIALEFEQNLLEAPNSQDTAAARSDKWLCVQRDLSWMSPRRTGRKKSRSRSSGGDAGRKSMMLTHVVDSDLGLPVHLRMQTSVWAVAGDATYVAAMYYQGGMESTRATFDLQMQPAEDSDVPCNGLHKADLHNLASHDVAVDSSFADSVQREKSASDTQDSDGGETLMLNVFGAETGDRLRLFGRPTAHYLLLGNVNSTVAQVEAATVRKK